MKLRPWIEWRARTGEWLVGLQVSLRFDSLARWLGRRRNRPTANKSHHQPPASRPDESDS